MQLEFTIIVIVSVFDAFFFYLVLQFWLTTLAFRFRVLQLFYENNFEMATMCFERAGDTMWERRAKASGLKAAADRMRGSNPEGAHTVLRQAAEIFDSIGRAESAAECFCDLGEYETAGTYPLMILSSLSC